MNKEDYVSLEVAKLLKEKGFNDLVFSQYTVRGSVWICNEPENFNESADCYSRPTLYEAQKWIWENYRLLITSFLDEPFVVPFSFLWSIQDAKKGIDNYDNKISKENYQTYEQALNAGILEALKLI